MLLGFLARDIMLPLIRPTRDLLRRSFSGHKSIQHSWLNARSCKAPRAFSTSRDVKDVEDGWKQQQLLFSSSEQEKKVAVSGRVEPVVIVIDTETTGFLTKMQEARIVEIAARDMAGGRLSCMETLVNPGNVSFQRGTSAKNGIYPGQVCHPDIPRWEEVGTLFIEFVESRRQPGAPIILAAHNGFGFDFPFMVYEFERCGISVPHNWLCVDTCRVVKALCGKAKGQSWNLEAFHTRFGPKGMDGSNVKHRAMADVDMLCEALYGLLVFHRATFMSLMPHTTPVVSTARSWQKDLIEAFRSRSNDTYSSDHRNSAYKRK